MQLIGKAVPRLEDGRLLRGQGRFTDDFTRPDQGYAVFVRSDVACGRLRRLDLDRAKTHPAVRLVIGAMDAADLGIKNFPSLGEMPGQTTRARPVMPVQIRHVGEILAMVVADDPISALDAAELIEIDIEPGTCRTERAYLWRHGDFAGIEERFRQARWQATVEAESNRVCVHPMETRAALAEFDKATGVISLVTGSQGAHKARDMIAAALGIDKTGLQVLTPDVGGAFGVKLQAYPEQALTALAAKLTAKPVKWAGSRLESSLMDAHGRAQELKATLALDAEGRFTALKVENRADLGAYCTGFGAFTPATSGGKVLGHVYRIDDIAIEVAADYSNTVPIDAYRGAGKPEMVYILERAIEEAARISGIDPIELRRKNLLQPSELPHSLALGQKIDTGEFPAILDRAVTISDWASFPARRAEARDRGRLAGIGIGMHMHVSGGFTNERSLIRIDPNGEISLDTGSQAGGQGHETLYAQIVAERFQVPLDTVRVRQGDTTRLEDGGGTGGSSSLPIAGVNIDAAATRLLQLARQSAADCLEVAQADLTYEDAAFTVIGTDRRLGLFKLAETDPLEFGCDYAGDHATYPNGAYVAEIEIDPDTGSVHLVRWTGVDDIGRVFNPAIALGQIHGGIIQGVGQALMEHCRYSPDGQILTATLMDYTLPRADDIGELNCRFHPVPAQANPLGAKGVGELGPAGALAPVHHAVLDALRDFPTGKLRFPFASELIWRIIHRKD